ncbi:uncharacterized protein LOC111109253 [Crassostrea virginica]|uniref:Uncharacterized protein LOC111109253 n=1 Tax=Crassostrea virginica TaxID=6565 RepID=A0A8B8BC96_CRAVI|nr:uncharacterized protein LOC111109253 [Crassostrea virginica]
MPSNTFLVLCLVTTLLQVQSAVIPGKKSSFVSTLEETVKSTLEKQLLAELAQKINWKNTPEFYKEVVQTIKENEGQFLGGIMRMVLEKSNGTGKLSVQTVEQVVSDFLRMTSHQQKRDEDDRMMPNYLNIKFGGFGK